MKVHIRTIKDQEAERVIIECVEVTEDIRAIEAFVQSRGDMLSGTHEGKQYTVSLRDVLYIEAVGELVFAYTLLYVLEVRIRLYALEKEYKDKLFARCSKSTLVNLLQIDSISPAMNGRLYAHMKNGERIIISRQYAGTLKRAIKAGVTREC